jgi:uncharacterized protein involved in outer membrane biogenesis
MNDKLLRYAGFAVALIILVWLGLIIAFKVMVNPNKIAQQVEKQIFAETGYKLVIKRAEASFIFSPSITFYDILVRNSNSQFAAKIMTASVSEFGIDLFSIFDENPTANNLTIAGLALDIEELENGKFNFQVANNQHKKFTMIIPSTIIIERGRINLTSLKSKLTHELRSINAQINVNDIVKISSNFNLNNNNYDFNGALQKNNDVYETKATLSNGKNFEEKIEYRGKIDFDINDLMINGEADFNLGDVENWLHLFDLQGTQEGIYYFLNNFKLAGKLMISYHNHQLKLHSENVKLNDSALNIEYESIFADKPQFSLKAILSAISINNIEQSIKLTNLYQSFSKLLNQQANGDISVNIGELKYNDTQLNGIEIDATLVDQELVLNKSVAKMEGETDILLFGIMRKDSDNLVNIDGSLEILGKDFQKFMNNLNLPNTEFFKNYVGDFRSKSNIFISEDLNLFSNIKLQVGEFFLEGNIENRPKGPENYNIALKTNNMNLDGFLDYIHSKDVSSEVETGYDVPKLFIPWLSGLANNYKVDLQLQNFNLYGEKGSSSKVIMEISRDIIQLHDIDFSWREMSISGDINITQTQRIPVIDCNIFISELDINNFIGRNFRRQPVERGNVISVWEDKPFNIDFMRGYDGQLNINVGELNHNSFTARNASLKTLIENGNWKISELSGDIWGGNVNAKGDIDVSSIISFNLDFLFKNIMIEELMESTFAIKPIYGRTNIYGNVDTGGISIANLIDSLRGQIILSGRDISIVGFDIVAMLQTLSSVRNINEVANAVRVSLLKGRSNFGTIEGSFYLDRGLLKSHGIKLRSKHSISTIKGQSNLVSWDMNYEMLFKLPTLSTMEVAEITLFLKESMDNPLLVVDSRNLESFMAKRKIGR